MSALTAAARHLSDWYDLRRWRDVPETAWRVEVENSVVTVVDPLERTVRIPVAEIARVDIRTTDQGPFAPDVWWEISGNTPRPVCRFPAGSTGEKSALAVFEALDGFDHGAVLEAMASTANDSFEVYRR